LLWLLLLVGWLKALCLQPLALLPRALMVLLLLLGWLKHSCSLLWLLLLVGWLKALDLQPLALLLRALMVLAVVPAGLMLVLVPVLLLVLGLSLVF
jgi:hypothetical protein